MKAVAFPEANVVFKGEGCLDLPAFRTDGLVVACFEFDEKELQQIADNGRVWIGVHGGGWAPLNLWTEFPFQTDHGFTQEEIEP